MAGYKLRCQRGFSLIEVLIALVILAVGLLGLAMFQVTAIKGNAIASKWTVATELAQDRLERFRHVGWNTIVSSSPSQPGDYSGLPGTGEDNTVRGTRFFRVWNVNPPTDNTNTFTTITVWCCWRDELGTWHNVMLVTQRTNVGGM